MVNVIVVSSVVLALAFSVGLAVWKHKRDYKLWSKALDNGIPCVTSDKPWPAPPKRRVICQ